MIGLHLDARNTFLPSAQSSDAGSNGCRRQSANLSRRSSPTSVAEQPDKKKLKPVARKRVRFAPSTKNFDGLAQDKKLFDDCMHEFFNCPSDRYATLRTLVQKGHTNMLHKINVHILDLMHRCSCGRSPVIRSGGGRSNFTDERFAPWLLKLSLQVSTNISQLKAEQSRAQQAGVERRPAVTAAFSL